MEKIVFALVLFSNIFLIRSQSQKESFVTLERKKQHNTIKLDYLHVKMPEGEIPMDVIGLHYDLNLGKYFYGGVGMYAAIIGDQGGLFTLGAEVGLQHKLYKNLYINSDFHFGGGGGYRYLVRDGAYINANIGLKLKTDKISYGLQYAYFDFFKGSIKSNGIAAYISIPSKLIYTDYRQSNKKFDKKALVQGNWNQKASKSTFTLRLDHFYSLGETKDQWYNPIENTLHTLGFEYSKYLDKRWFSYIHLDAIFKGLPSGFMDLFVGAGYEPIQTKSLKIFTKIGVGASGGRVEREGGLTLYPNIGFEKRIKNGFSITGHGGYIRAPFGNFEAFTLGYGIKYTTYKNGIYHPEIENKTESVLETEGIQVSLQNQSYFKATSTVRPPIDLQLLAIQINYEISERFYLAGQASFAYEGESGGYADGMVGIGWYLHKRNRDGFEFFLETLIGAGGGAHVDTGAGFSIKPKIGVQYYLRENISVLLSGGKMIAPFGSLNATNLNFGISYNFATLNL